MHKCLAERLNAPDYNGNNFDAQSDVLSDIGGSERVMIVFKNMSDFLNDNKKLCAKLIRVLAEAEEENEYLSVWFDVKQSVIYCVILTTSAVRYKINNNT